MSQTRKTLREHNAYLTPVYCERPINQSISLIAYLPSPAACFGWHLSVYIASCIRTSHLVLAVVRTTQLIQFFFLLSVWHTCYVNWTTTVLHGLTWYFTRFIGPTPNHELTAFHWPGLLSGLRPAVPMIHLRLWKSLTKWDISRLSRLFHTLLHNDPHMRKTVLRIFSRGYSQPNPIPSLSAGAK